MRGSGGSRMHAQCITFLLEQLQQLAVYCDQEQYQTLFGCMQIAIGKDADLLLLDQSTLELQYVYAKGLLVRTPEWTRGGMFERGDRIRPIKPEIVL